MNEEMDSVVDEIVRAVGKEVSVEEVKKNLKKFIEYGVPVDQAKRAVIQKYGGKGVIPSSNKKKLGDVEPYDKRLSLLGKIAAVEEREVEVKGEKRKIFRGLVGDETAVLPFTAWKDFGFGKGDVVKIKNASAGEWGGQPRLNFSEWTEVEKTDESIDLIKRKAQRYSVIDLKPGLSNVEVKAKILTMEERDVSVEGKNKKVYSGIMGDETGKIRYTSWADFGIKEGDVVEISGAYTKSWRGAPQIVFNENAKVEKLDEALLVENIGTEKIPIHKVVEAGGGVDLSIEGVVIEIQKGSGIIYRCPKCNRAIREGVCVIDGEVDGILDLRIKAVIDDGTGAVNAIFGRDATEKLIEKNLQDYEKMTEKSGEEAVEKDMEDLLIAHPVHVTGNALSDDYGVTVIVQNAEVIHPEIKEEGEELLAKVEALK
ncbi:MAG: hypothetical protein U9O96_04705 [Candidatus Thermoplasmatota archaeon]|nr:hypothetical protein [Candidatus Thermoplasmatota archaeon]